MSHQFVLQKHTHTHTNLCMLACVFKVYIKNKKAFIHKYTYNLSGNDMHAWRPITVHSCICYAEWKTLLCLKKQIQKKNERTKRKILQTEKPVKTEFVLFFSFTFFFIFLLFGLLHFAYHAYAWTFRISNQNIISHRQQLLRLPKIKRHC